MSKLQPLQFYFMHFMPYPDVAPGRPQGQWVDIPNRRDQVAERIAFWCEQAQSSKIVLHLHVGDMPHWKAVKNITLFAEEVIPRVRKLTSSALQVAAE